MSLLFIKSIISFILTFFIVNLLFILLFNLYPKKEKNTIYKIKKEKGTNHQSLYKISIIAHYSILKFLYNGTKVAFL